MLYYSKLLFEINAIRLFCNNSKRLIIKEDIYLLFLYEIYVRKLN